MIAAKAVVGAAPFVAVVGVGVGLVVAVRQHLRRRAVVESAEDLVEGLTEFIGSAAMYDPEVREAVEGESHDFVQVAEVEVEVPGGEGEEPKRVRKRRVQKMRYEHRIVEAGAPFGPYLADVVTETRLHYNHREATAYNMSLARAYMIRIMKGHGMRPAHIAADIDRMVLAVFLQTDQQVAMRSAAGVLRRAGRMGGFTGV